MILLSPLRASDLDPLRSAIRAEPVLEPPSIPRPAREEAAGAWLREEILATGRCQTLTLAIRHADQSLAGTFRLIPLAPAMRGAQLSYWVAPDARNRGYASAALRLALRLAADQLGARRLYTAVDETNLPSRAVLTRNGFVLQPAPVGHRGVLYGEAGPWEPDPTGWTAPQDGPDAEIRFRGEEGMLTIRAAQIHLFRRLRFAEMAPDIARDAIRKFPQLFAADQPVPEVAEVIAEALDRAWEYGLRQDRHLRAFGELSVVCGPHFDYYPPFRDLLTCADLEPVARFEALFQIAREEDWIIAGRLRYRPPKRRQE